VFLAPLEDLLEHCQHEFLSGNFSDTLGLRLLLRGGHRLVETAEKVAWYGTAWR
jgi:hypothetical protein